MFSIHDKATTLCDGISRREALRVGGLGLGGLSLAGLLKQRAQANPAGNSNLPGFGKAKSVIVFGLIGGLPQHETWDPKPNAPQQSVAKLEPQPPKQPAKTLGP